MKIFVSAAEISSDIHAEKILKAIQKKLGEQGVTVEWMGIGGHHVSSLPGFRSIESAENLRTMGFVEVARKYSFFKQLILRASRAIQEFDPDLILTFDYPDFHFRVMEKVREGNLAPRALRVCGIPPKVWVWRTHRVEKIRELYHGVWVIFPFEKDFYQTLGIPVIYEGNPLLEQLGVAHPLEKQELETITVMPGSREGELQHHLPVIPEALELFARKIGKKIVAQVPIPSGISKNTIENKLTDTAQVEYRFLENGSAQSLKQTRIGLIKSGTSSLEAAVSGCVPVIFYKMNWLSEQIFKLLVRGFGGYLGPVGLPNVLLGIKRRENNVFPELLGPAANPENIAEQLTRIYQNAVLRKDLESRCDEVKSLFFLDNLNSDSAVRSAGKILDWKKNPPVSQATAVPGSILIRLISFLWSSINFVRRRLVKAGVVRVYQVRTPSILVGNLQAGGAGKTPVVIALAKEAVKKGKKVAVISRGYGATDKNPLGDEPQEILNEVPQVILAVNSDRVKAIREVEQQKPDLILFDDGFQNLKFSVSKTILLVTDRTRSQVPYRDFDSEVRFADFVVGTKGSDFREVFRKKGFYRIEWEWNQKVTQPVWLYCGIADPRDLVRFYQERGLRIRKVVTKADHEAFSEQQIREAINAAAADGCLLAMTEKDRVKIPSEITEILVLKRSIRNRDWIDAVFASTLE